MLVMGHRRPCVDTRCNLAAGARTGTAVAVVAEGRVLLAHHPILAVGMVEPTAEAVVAAAAAAAVDRDIPAADTPQVADRHTFKLGSWLVGWLPAGQMQRIGGADLLKED